MLQRLHIENLAIIDALTLEFADGFTVLTGETGAGKSIIIGALNLILGERASNDDIRTGAESAVAEALFDITGNTSLARLLAEYNLLEEDGGSTELIIRREISATRGRGRCLVNGRLTPLSRLKRIGEGLVDLHGQHQHQSLLRVELHREILDAFGGPTLSLSLAAYRETFQQHAETLRRLRALDRDEREIARQKDLLEYQLCEIREVAPEPGEDTALDQEHRRLEHADALKQNAADANDILFEGESRTPTVATLLSECKSLLDDASRIDPGSIEELSQRLGSASAELEDIAGSLRTYAAAIESDPARLEEVDDRLHAIRQIKRKYGDTIEEALAEAARFEEELHALTHSGEEQKRLEARRVELERELARAAETLSEKRAAAGEKFARGLLLHLKDLEMPRMRFLARLDREEESAAQENGTDSAAITFPDGKRYRVWDHGVDCVEFLISPNPGEALKPLRRIASGGELSRIMLALKALMRSLDQVPTLVFDEIDTGISGRVGTSVGEKMAGLSERFQVICITHLPQIAARGQAHFAVRKTQQKNRTLTRVEPLDDAERLKEIARLLGGQADSAIALIHAEELLRGAGS